MMPSGRVQFVHVSDDGKIVTLIMYDGGLYRNDVNNTGWVHIAPPDGTSLVGAAVLGRAVTA